MSFPHEYFNTGNHKGQDKKMLTVSKYRFGCWQRFASPDKGFAQQSPGLAKCAGATAWE
jgi:hypothetical protein